MRARYQAGRAKRQYKSLSNVAIYETTDPDVVILQYDLHGEFIETAEPFSPSWLPR